MGFLINDKFAPGFSLHNWNLERNRPRRYKEAKLFAQKKIFGSDGNRARNRSRQLLLLRQVQRPYGNGWAYDARLMGDVLNVFARSSAGAAAPPCAKISTPTGMIVTERLPRVYDFHPRA